MYKEFANVCSYCGSSDIDAIDSFEDSEKYKCGNTNCENDFIHWFEDNSVTDRHGFDIDEATNNKED